MYPYVTGKGEPGIDYEKEGVPPKYSDIHSNPKSNPNSNPNSNSLDQLIKYLKKEIDIHADSLLLKVSNHYDELIYKLNREKQKAKEEIQQWKKERKDEFDKTNEMSKVYSKLFYNIMDKNNLSKIFSERQNVKFEQINIPKQTYNIKKTSKIDKYVSDILDELVSRANNNDNNSNSNNNNSNEKKHVKKNVNSNNRRSMSDDHFYGDSDDGLNMYVSMAPDIDKSRIESVDFMDEVYNVNEPDPKWSQKQKELWKKRQEHEKKRNKDEEKLNEIMEINSDKKERFHVNKLDKKAIRNRVTQLSINDWQLTDEEWNDVCKNGRGMFDMFRERPSKFGMKLGRLIKHNGTTLDLSGDEWVALKNNEKNIIRECLTFQRVIFNSPRKFPKLGKLLKSIDTLILNKIGLNFGLKGIEWVAPILTSKYSAIRTVHIENGCDLDNKCLKYLNDEFKEGFKHIEHHKHLHLKCLRIETNMGSEKTDAKSTFLDVMLQYSNIDKICLDRSPYELKGERSMETPGGDNTNEKNPPRWEFVLYVLRDF